MDTTAAAVAPVVFTELVAEGITATADKVVMLPPTSLKIRPGENVVIAGPNGVGKTTFLRILTGNMLPTAGIITLDGRPVDERDRATRRVIAPLIGPIAGYRDLTVGDHLILVDQTWGGDRDGAATRIIAVLERLDIYEYRDRYLSQLSSGQRQLVELSIVLLRPSALLVLDEPEQRLDAGRRELLSDVLRERVDAQSSVVWVCHDEALTERTATRVEYFPQKQAEKPPAKTNKTKKNQQQPKKPKS